jgi:hypothetical protein
MVDDSLRARLARGWSAREPWMVAAAALVVTLVHGAVTDPRYLFCDDLGLFVTLQHYTYLHPWDAFLGIPSPSFLFGSQIHDPDFPSFVPLVPALLAHVAPSDPYALGAFEWHVTSACVAIAVFGVYLFVRRFDVPRPIALALAILYPFFTTVSHDYHVAFAMRAKLLLPLALALTARAVRTRRYRDAAAMAALWILCLGQSALTFWVVEALVVVTMVLAIHHRRALLEAVRERRREAALRALPLALAAIAVAAVYVPPYLRMMRAMRGAAWTAELASSGGDQLEYLLAGRALAPSSLVPSALATGFSPLAAAGLSLFVCLFVRRLLRRGVTFATPLPTKVALVAFAVALPLFLLQHLPGDAFRAEGDHVLVYGVRLPQLLASLGHMPVHTWLVQMELAGTFAAVMTLAAWARSDAPMRQKLVDGVAAVLVHATAIAAAAIFASGEAPLDAAVARDLATSALLASVVLAGVALVRRPAVAALLPVLALAFVVPRWAELLEANARRTDSVQAVLVAELGLPAHMPAELSHRYEWRVGTYGVIRSLPLLLDSGGTTCCGVRMLSTDLVTFLRDLHAVKSDYLPYRIDLDWARLDAQGVLPLFGIRWWIVDDRAPLPFLRGRRIEVDGPVFVHEDDHALPRAWALRTWEQAAPEHASSARRLEELGRAGSLRATGLVDGEAGSVDRAEVRVVSVRPGELRLATDGSGPFVVATGEIAGGSWTATVDGGETPVRRVNVVFVGAKVPAGAHELVLRHRIR